MNHLNPAESILAAKMLDAEPLLDLQGSDNKLFQVALQDFTNYLKLNWAPAGNDAGEFSLEQRIEQYYSENAVEFEAFAQVWVAMWLKKWKSRVKLLLKGDCKSESEHVAKTLADGEPLWGKLQCKQEMVDMVVSTLIKYGEICGTELFAQHLIKLELGKKADMDLENAEELFAVLNSVLQRAHETAMCSGPLMFVKVGKAYFNAVKQ